MDYTTLKSLTWDVSASTVRLPKHAEILDLLGSGDETHCCDALCAYTNSQLSKLDSISYSTYTFIRTTSDPFQNLCSHLRKKEGIDNCNRGWLKMFELLTVQGLLNFKFYSASTGSDRKTIYALFNGELPGGFLCATQHFVKSRGLTLAWLASSLHPTATATALDDTFNILKEHPKKWLMTNKDHQNGDMTDPASVDHLVTATGAALKSIRPATKVNLYVADGGMDIDKQYSHQEVLHQGILLGEIITCMKVLARGGNAVVKCYTFCTDFMRSLIALCAFSFEQMLVSKPVTSRPGNTEVYLILLNYKGFDGAIVRRLEDSLDEVAIASKRSTAAKPLLDMRVPKMAAMNSRCIYILNSLSNVVRNTVDEYVRRSKNMDSKATWKNAKIGNADRSRWLACMGFGKRV